MIVTLDDISDFTPKNELPFDVINNICTQHFLDFQYLNTKAYGDHAIYHVIKLTELNFNELKAIPNDNKVKIYLTELWSNIEKCSDEDAVWRYLCKFNAMWVDRFEYLCCIKNKNTTISL